MNADIIIIHNTQYDKSTHQTMHPLSTFGKRSANDCLTFGIRQIWHLTYICQHFGDQNQIVNLTKDCVWSSATIGIQFATVRKSCRSKIILQNEY